jgi:threonine/homoserine/homoserine lactone efflux protein
MFMEKRAEWSLAAKNGLILSIITIATTLIVALTPEMKIVANILTFVKLAAVISLVYYFMKQFSEEQEEVTYGQSFKYGFKICFLSSIVCTFWIAILYLFIQPDVLNQSLEIAFATIESSGMSIDMDFEELEAILPTAIIISQFFNCMFWGVIIPAIAANWTKKEIHFFEQ